MKYAFSSLLLLTLGLTSCVKDRIPEPATSTGPSTGGSGGGTSSSQKLIHYWSFNGSSLLTPDTTIGGAAIAVSGTYDDVTPGSLLNGRRGADTGKALRVRNPSTTMTLKLPTTGYKQPVVSFAVMRTDSGPQENIVSYTLDGTNYVNTGLQPTTITVGTAFSQFSFDFSTIPGANNNPNFGLRITFNIGNTGTSGNDRYDNVSVDAIPDSTVTPPPPPVVVAGDTLLHYWNFNANTSDMTVFTTPTQSIGGASLLYSGIGVQDTTQEGTTVNARNNDAAGNALRLRNPATSFTMTLPTTGFKDIRLKYAVMRTNSGAQSNTITYTTDGTTYVSTGLATTTVAVGTSFALVTHDFTGIAAASNNPNFKVKIEFTSGNTGTSGNDRFDNITVEGKKQ